MKFETWHAFVLGAVLSWGVYVPVLHQGQTALGGALKAFLCVGVAYFLTAVVIPLGLLLMRIGGEEFSFNQRGITFATLGGVAGAAGALCIIMSIKYDGKPLFVAPLVFAGAPIVNALVSMAWHPPKFLPGWMFYVGLVLAALGAGLVLYSKAELDNRSKPVQAAVRPGEITFPSAPH